MHYLVPVVSVAAATAIPWPPPPLLHGEGNPQVSKGKRKREKQSVLFGDSRREVRWGSRLVSEHARAAPSRRSWWGACIVAVMSGAERGRVFRNGLTRRGNETNQQREGKGRGPDGATIEEKHQ